MKRKIAFFSIFLIAANIFALGVPELNERVCDYGGILNARQKVEITDYLEDVLREGDAYDAVEILTDINREMKRYTPEEYYNMLMRKLQEIRRNNKITLEEDGRCPECGEYLEYERYENGGTYVPYGDRMVKAYDDGRMVCPNCGYSLD